MKVTLTCPHCSSKQEIEAPKDHCLATHTCKNCHKLVKASPKAGECTCVICEYSDDKCPIEDHQ